MAFLVLLIVATAVMFAWLLGSVTRFALSDLRLPGLRPSHGQPPGNGNAEAAPIVGAPEAVAPEPWSDPELDAERAVREHLYGPRERRA